jgi:hypothetical protein
MNLPMTEAVSADGQRSARQQQNRDAQMRRRAPRRLGLVTRRLVLEPEWLDSLEVRGYLDPDQRGERLDECDAIELFLADALAKSR